MAVETEPLSAPAVRAQAPPARWTILAVLSIVQFMLYLDDTIVNVALPSIRSDLGFSQASLTWVVNAYVLMYGGFLLLGGRLADLFGRRRMFLIGLTLFAAASLVNALAASEAMLIGSRGVQGLGAALVSPAALSLVVTLFRDSQERAKALALWSALAGAGAALGVVLSGVITSGADWRWIFYINLPAAVAAYAFVRRRVDREPGRGGYFDAAGAVVGTAALVVFVYTLLETGQRGWGDAVTLVGFAAALALALLFVVLERRVPVPLVPLGFFRNRRRNIAIGLQYLLAAVLFGAFFLSTLYMQQVLGFTPLAGGLAWLAFFVGMFAGFASGTQALLRYGVRPVIVAGLVVAGAGMLLLARIPVDGHYWADLAGPMAVLGLGLGWGFVPVGVTALHDAPAAEAGLASALITTGQQIGGALGLAVLVALATSRMGDLVHAGVAADEAQVRGTRLAFVVAGGLCLIAAPAVARWIGVLRPSHLPEPLAAPAVDGGAAAGAPAPSRFTIPASTRQVRYDDLYARWELGNWSANRIDFSQDAIDWNERMTQAQRDAATWLFAMFFHGEDAVATELAPYIVAAPREEHRYFLATQQVDEARHSVMFKRFLHEVGGLGDGSAGGGKGATSEMLTWGHRQVFGRLDRMAEELWRDPSPPRFAAAMTLYHVVIEGAIAQPGQHVIERALEELDLLPGLRQALALVAVDEQRHVAFGVRAIAELLEEHGEPVQDAVVELLREVLPWTSGLARPPGDDHAYTAPLGFTIDHLYEESARAFEGRIRATGLPVDEIARFPFPMDIPARERARRGLRMLEAQLIGPKERPFTYDPEALGMLFDAMRRQADHTRLAPGTVVRWDFTDADPWELRFGSDGVTAAPAGGGRAKLTLRSSLEDFVDLSAGRESLAPLVLRRRLRVRGSVAVLARLPRVFA